MGFNQQKCGLIGISHDFTIEIWVSEELEGCPSWTCSKAGLDNDPSDQFVVHDFSESPRVCHPFLWLYIPIFGESQFMAESPVLKVKSCYPLVN